MTKTKLQAYAVTRTTWETFKVMAEDAESAEDIIIGMEIGIKPQQRPEQLSAELNTTKWDEI